MGQGIGDGSIGHPAVPNVVPDASAKLAADAQNTGKWAGDNPIGEIIRLGTVTTDGIVHTPAGMLHTAENDLRNPEELAKMVTASAAIGAGVKLLLPETGAVASIATKAMGAYFLAQSAPGFIDAYEQGSNAKTWNDINEASKKWGDASGMLVDNSVVGLAGYKIGSGAAGKLLATESMDNFAAAKATVWKGVEAKLPDMVQKFGITDATTALKPHYVNGRAEFKGSARAEPTDAQGNALPAQEIDPSAPMSVTVKVARQNQGTFDRLVERIKAGKAEPISREEFMQRFSADPKSVQAIKDFAKQNGFAEVSDADINHGARTVRLSGTVGQMQNAFQVKLANFGDPDSAAGTFRGRVGTYSVEEALGSHVDAILGLDQRDIVKPKYVMAPPPDLLTPDRTGLVGEDGTVEPKAPTRQAPLPADAFAKAYGADPEKYSGQGKFHAFNSFGGTIDQAVPDYLIRKGIDPTILRTIDRSSGGTKADPDGANVENNMDAVTQKLVMPKATVDMIANDNSTEGFVGGIDYVNHPPTGVEYNGSSTSWGGPDKQAWNKQGRAALDQSLKDGIALGKTHSFSSGDDGITDKGSLPAQTDYPGSSGNGLDVGGTKLFINPDGSRGKETTWSTSGATGGGVSEVEPRPVYQNAITWIKNVTGSAFRGRIVPDIAANASPETPVEVPTANGLAGVGGTSFSNPLVYSMIVGQLSEATGKPVGFINTKLYQWGQDPAIAKKVFNDITEGDNGMGGPLKYSAGPGFDAVTGWGSPNFQGMLAELQNPTHTPLIAGLRRTAFGLRGEALRTAHTIATDPSVILQMPRGIAWQTNQNQTGG